MTKQTESQNRIDKIKCRFCDWTIPKWTTTKGRHIERYRELLKHIAFEHPEKLKELEDLWTQKN